MQKLSDFYQSIFGCKTYKISLDAGCTCPNRDGTKGTGGCIFCSENGSGDVAAGRTLPIKEQVEAAKELVQSKIRGRGGERTGKYIAYFQNFSSTYGDAKTLLKKYREALACENVTGLAVATRPDCLTSEMLQGLSEIARTYFVQLELGLQTSNEKTGAFINRCYTNKDYTDAVYRIRKAAPQIHIVTHLIFGLPGETEQDMLNSVKFVVEQNIPHPELEDCHLELENCHAELVSASIEKDPDLRRDDSPRMHDSCHPELEDCHAELEDCHPELFSGSSFGLKITSLYILKNTPLAAMYEAGNFQPLTKEAYFSLLEKALPLLPENCIVHRLTGDPPKRLLIAPAWTTDKKRVLNELQNIIKKSASNETL